MIIKVKSIINYYIQNFKIKNSFDSIPSLLTKQQGLDSDSITLFTKQLDSQFKFHTQPSRIQVLIPFHSRILTKQGLRSLFMGCNKLRDSGLQSSPPNCMSTDSLIPMLIIPFLLIEKQMFSWHCWFMLMTLC